MITRQDHRFPHKQLIAYQVALEMARLAREVSDGVPRGYRSVCDQLIRASVSAVLLIGEGANRASAAQKRQRYVEARGECGEVAAAAELLAVLELGDAKRLRQLQARAGRAAALLGGLVRRHA